MFWKNSHHSLLISEALSGNFIYGVRFLDGIVIPAQKENNRLESSLSPFCCFGVLVALYTFFELLGIRNIFSYIYLVCKEKNYMFGSITDTYISEAQ